MKKYKVKVNGKTYEVLLESVEEVGGEISTQVKKEEVKVESSSKVGKEILSPLQGNICSINVKVGQKVKKGDVLLLIEAMKLENEVNAPFDGEVVEVLVSKGQSVASKQLLCKIK